MQDFPNYVEISPFYHETSNCGGVLFFANHVLELSITFRFKINNNCDTMGVGRRISLSVLARNPHKGTEREISGETGSGGREGRPERRQREPVDKGGLKRTVSRREQNRPLKEQGNQEMIQHSKWLCGSFAQIFARDSLQMHGKLLKSVTNSLLLRLELTQVSRFKSTRKFVGNFIKKSIQK